MSERSVELNTSLLLNAYAVGVFPMANGVDDPEIYWVDPAIRGVLPLDGFHVPRSLAKRMRRGGYEVTVDRAFDAVLDGCADREETWINAKIRGLYLELHEFGYGHSVEVWMNGALSGGLYGVSLGAAFFGESMFSRQPDASKIALAHLVARLRAGGFTLLDTQFVTAHLRKFGAVEITRREYHRQLDDALARDAEFLALHPDADVQEILQLSTQTS